MKDGGINSHIEFVDYTKQENFEVFIMIKKNFVIHTVILLLIHMKKYSRHSM